jgi:hypothetical protein
MLRFGARSALHNPIAGAGIEADDCQRGRLVASYPAKFWQVDRSSTDDATTAPRAADAQSPDGRSAPLPSAMSHADGPFVHSSAQRRPQALERTPTWDRRLIWRMRSGDMWARVHRPTEGKIKRTDVAAGTAPQVFVCTLSFASQHGTKPALYEVRLMAPQTDRHLFSTHKPTAVAMRGASRIAISTL